MFYWSRKKGALYSLAEGLLGWEYRKIVSLSGLYALVVFSLSYVFRDKFSYNPVIAFISSISYPFYVIHAIAGYVLMFILIKNGCNPFLATTIALTILGFIAYLMHRFIEKPLILFGKKC